MLCGEVSNSDDRDKASVSDALGMRTGWLPLVGWDFKLRALDELTVRVLSMNHPQEKQSGQSMFKCLHYTHIAIVSVQTDALYFSIL